MRTVTGIFPSMPQVERAVRELEELGVPRKGISIIAGNKENRHHEYLEKSKRAARGAGAAAASGAEWGGGIGIVASLAALAIPGVGPILAGGAVVNILAGLGIGAAGGGLIATFRNMAIPHEEAPLYEEAVKRGALLLVAEVDDPMEQEVVELMKAQGARELQDEVDTWKETEWSGPKADPHPYVLDSTVKAHEPPEE